jgi:hypothetical protein
MAETARQFEDATEFPDVAVVRAAFSKAGSWYMGANIPGTAEGDPSLSEGPELPHAA